MNHDPPGPNGARANLEEETMKTFDYYTIEPSFDQYAPAEIDGWWLIGWGEYEESSVLAGQTQKARLDVFATKAEAQAAMPTAEVFGSPSINPARVPDTQPAGFDPADCGEAWGEDDY